MVRFSVRYRRFPYCLVKAYPVFGSFEKGQISFSGGVHIEKSDSVGCFAAAGRAWRRNAGAADLRDIASTDPDGCRRGRREASRFPVAGPRNPFLAQYRFGGLRAVAGRGLYNLVSAQRPVRIGHGVRYPRRGGRPAGFGRLASRRAQFHPVGAWNALDGTGRRIGAALGGVRSRRTRCVAVSTCDLGQADGKALAQSRARYAYLRARRRLYAVATGTGRASAPGPFGVL